ncbi:MAG TPA: cytochrome b/b6 domain-containing protein [Ottowia sp.]|uniref:cytochrome b n=1 Tax=Ottowia sp. TaxID=1898956 RepID=UPI002BE15A8B|nr:cytochrome b/b6 domain-containing protein [Ottowia sp.]HOB66022.1 cytochrome b/b6 domain-containing protein [Ottowia sp.]
MATPNNDPEKIGHLKGHMMMGMAVGVFLIVRLVLRWFSTKPEPASSAMPWADKLARLMHILFYILIFLQVGAGMAMSIGANLPDIVFNGNGSLPTDFWSLPTRGMHSAIALVLAGMICLHAGAALYHQFVLKDGLLARMWFGKRN